MCLFARILHGNSHGLIYEWGNSQLVTFGACPLTGPRPAMYPAKNFNLIALQCTRLYPRRQYWRLCQWLLASQIECGTGRLQ